MMEEGFKDMSEVMNLVRMNSEKQYGCPYTWLYTFDDVYKIFEDNAMTVTKIEKRHIFRWNIPEYCRNEYVLNDYWKHVAEDDVKQWEKELGWHTLVIAKRHHTHDEPMRG